MPSSPGTLHENLARNDEVIGSSDRSFGLTIAAVCGVIGVVRPIFHHSHAFWWLGAALAVLLFALLWPAALHPLNRLWLRLGLLLYKVVNPVVMTLLYGVAIVPMGLLMRLCGKDPLRLRRDPQAATYWISREPPGPPPETMRNQF
jgi:hypothetical protein